MDQGFSLWMVVAFPALTSVVVLIGAGLAARLLGEERARVGAVYLALFGTSMALFFLLQAVFGVLLDPRVPALVQDPTPWLVGDSIGVPRSLVLDPLAGACALVVAVACTATHLFCVGWAGERPDAHRVFAWVGALEAAVLLLLMARSLALVIIAWYAIGLLVYLAVGWRSDARASVAARRFVQLDLAGSALLLVSALVLLTQAPGLDVDVLRLAASPGAKSVLRIEGPLGTPVSEWVGLLMVVAIAVRCGQFPFARAGVATRHAPLPLLGLVQGAALIVPAAYLVVRLEVVFAIAPTAMALLTTIGLGTAIVGALMALGERRVDGVLTYSTMSQAGLVLAALGLGAWVAALLLAGAHAVAKLGLALACACCEQGETAQDGAGPLKRVRVRTPIVARTSFVFAASLAGLLPCAGALGYIELAAPALLNGSAWSPGINYLGLLILLGTVAATSAHAFRLHYVVFREPRAAAGEEAQVGMFAMGLVPLAAFVLLLGVVVPPELMGLSRILDSVVEPLTRVSTGYGGESQAFRIGPLESPASTGMHWFLLLAVVGTAMFVWNRSREHWLAGERALHGTPRYLVGVAQGIAGLERRCWEILGRLVDVGSTFAHLIIDRIAVDQGAALTGRFMAETGRRARTVGFGGPRKATLAALMGVAFVLGWIYFKPSASGLLPNRVHGFGGLRPTLKSPAKATPNEPREPLKDPAGGDPTGGEPPTEEQADDPAQPDEADPSATDTEATP